MQLKSIVLLLVKSFENHLANLAMRAEAMISMSVCENLMTEEGSSNANKYAVV